MNRVSFKFEFEKVNDSLVTERLRLPAAEERVEASMRSKRQTIDFEKILSG
jgi:hypothetical protein